MNPSSKDWLYLFKEQVDIARLKNIGTSNNSEKPCLFTAMIKTGLLFGYPSDLLFSVYKNNYLWNNADKIKIAYTECLFACFLKNRDQDFEHFVTECIEFFKNTFFDEFDTLLTSKKEPIATLETILDKRIHNITIFSTKHWLNSDYNTIAFVDILKFQIWLNERSAAPSIILLLRNCILKAGEINKSSEKASTNIIEYFIGTNSNSIEIDIRSYILQFPKSIQDILKKTAFAFLTLTYLADEILDENEQTELYKQAFELQIKQIDAHIITLQTEEFALNNYHQLPYFSKTNSILKLKNTVQYKLHSLVKKNKASIIQELKDSREALELLAKWNTQELNDEEKKKIKSQLTDILKTLPSLAIFMLPGGAIALPILYKIIPEELLKPSAFRNRVNKK